jgi:hypothetical protein
MNKRQAIKILEKQRDKLEDKSVYKDDIWVYQSASYIKDFFGEESPEFHFLKRFTFSAIGTSCTTDVEWRNELANKKQKAYQFINSCIETLEHKSLYEKPKLNFLQRWDNATLSSILIPIASVLFMAGYKSGERFTDTKNFRLEQEVGSLKDSINYLNLILDTNLPPEKDDK